LFEEPIATSKINNLYNTNLSFTESICNISELVYFSARKAHLVGAGQIDMAYDRLALV